VNKLKRFFWLCSGSNLKILDSAPTEGAKYAGIGATIFFTGVFASIAGTYAIFTFTDNIWLSSLFGLVWGGMIFNLVRYIVSSMRKSSTWKKEWTMALPRIVLAIIISLVIARPLELKIFEKEIATELILMNDEIARARIDSTNNYYQKLISANQKDIDQLLTAVVSMQNQRDELRALASAEADGTGGSMKRNPGPIYKIKKANADKADEELTVLNSTNQQQIDNKRAQEAKWQLENNEKLLLLENPDYSGFAARLDALSRLTSNKYSIWLANLFIILLFIAIETAPVLVKLISSKGPYDFLLATEEYEHELLWLAQKAKLHSKTRKAAKRYSREEVEYIDQYLSSNLN